MTNSMNRFIVSMIRRLPFGRVSVFNMYALLAGSVFGYSVGWTWFGCSFKCDYRDLVQNRILFFGVWEPNVTEVIRRSLREGDVFVDVGANIGYDSLMASSLVGTGGRVVSIEASPKTFALLQDNVETNKLRNVRLVNIAASDREGSVELFSGFENNIGSASVIKQQGRTLEAIVQALPLDRILTPKEICSVRMVKIDIEGAELPVVSRIFQAIELWPSEMEIVLEVTPSDNIEKWNELFRRIGEAGYGIYVVENDWHLRAYLDKDDLPAPLQRIHKLTDDNTLDLYITKADNVAKIGYANDSAHPHPPAPVESITPARKIVDGLWGGAERLA
jgi:FkbM family methyltransferase